MTLIRATIDRIDTNLIRVRAESKNAGLARLTMSLAVLAIRPAPLIMAIAVFVAIVSILGGMVAIGGLIGLLLSSRLEAQSIWNRQRYRFDSERSGQ